MEYSNKVSEWINSDEYKTILAKILANIVRKAELSNSEATTASAFETELYFNIR